MVETKLTFYLTDEDRERIQDFAKEQRLSVGAFCRFIILKFIKKNEVQDGRD